MKIPLNEFEQIVDETILKRGLSYFERGVVTAFSEVSKGEFDARVSGTEEYSVQLSVDKDIVTSHRCNCPYDRGHICKHAVAAIFYLRQDELALNEPILKKPNKRRKTKSANQQIKELLKIISHEELMGYVQQNSKEDKKFRNHFLTAFGHLNEDQSKENYQYQIHSILQAAVGRRGWIDRSGMRSVVHAINPILANAKKYMENGSHENVFFIGTALLEEMVEAYHYADDSGGEIRHFAHEAFELLSELVKTDLPEPLRIDVFHYCISAFEKGLFSRWDWHIEIIGLAGDSALNEEEADMVLAYLDKAKKEYEQEKAQFLRLNLLTRFKDKDLVDKFVEEHLSNPEIRKSEIAKAIDNQNFERAIGLCKAGIKQDEENRPRAVFSWYDWLLHIALTQKDIPKIIELARYMLLNNNGDPHTHFTILKKHVDIAKWDAFLAEVITELQSKGQWKSMPLIRMIYIEEQMWDKLLGMLKEYASLSQIETDEKYLSAHYAPELVKLYHDDIIYFLEDSLGRKYYKTACRYIRRMKKLGGDEQATNLIEFLRKKYAQRRALMEELDQV
jgi:hypothetical protein